MNDNDVSSYYKEALATDSFTVHNNFLNMLLKDGSALGMERHYGYFKDSKNADLKRILGNGFLKRGKEGVLFLEEKLKTETDALAKSNVIHLIGLSYNKEYLPYILPYLDDANDEIRYKAIIACGWLGDAEAIKILKEWKLTKQVVLDISEHKEFLEDNTYLTKSLENRLQYFNTLNLLQIELIRRAREEETLESQINTIHITINGVATGLRNSG